MAHIHGSSITNPDMTRNESDISSGQPVIASQRSDDNQIPVTSSSNTSSGGTTPDWLFFVITMNKTRRFEETDVMGMNNQSLFQHIQGRHRKFRSDESWANRLNRFLPRSLSVRINNLAPYKNWPPNWTCWCFSDLQLYRAKIIKIGKVRLLVEV